MKIRSIALLFLLFVMMTMLVLPLHAQEPTTDEAPPPLRIERDVPYFLGEGSHDRNRLDVYAPAEATNAPVLMFAAGGAWVTSETVWQEHVGVYLAENGFVVVIPDYQLKTPEQLSPEPQAFDLARAFVWIKDNIVNYGGDPNRVVIGGHSAGGHLTSLVAYNPNYLNALGRSPNEIAGLIPVSMSFSEFGEISGAGSGFTYEFSPAKFLEEFGFSPPTLLIHAINDLDGIAAQQSEWARVLRNRGVPVEVEQIGDVDHGNVTRHGHTLYTMGQWMAALFGIPTAG